MKDSSRPTLTNLHGDRITVQEVFDVIGFIMNMSIGCLFVVTMYQISIAIKQINDPLSVDIEKTHCYKLCVNIVALCFVCCFTITVIIVTVVMDATEDSLKRA